MQRDILRLLRKDCTIGSSVRVRLWEHERNDRIGGAPCAHPAVELAWVESGAVLYRIGSTETVVSPGQAFIVPTGVEHATTMLTASRAGALWLDPEMVAEIADAIGQGGRQLAPGLATEHETILTLARVVHREIRGATQGHLLAAEAMAEAMTVAMLRAAPGQDVHATARHPRVLAAIERMQTAYAEPLTVEELARAAGMSRFHFSRLFREEVGEAPYRYLLGVRLGRAAELLRCGRHSVTEAAIAVGFGDLSRFSRMFRERFGQSPAYFARAARGTGRVLASLR